ncbi:MAG: calcium/sodium antiporter [Lachnospirales bacterium]
MEVLKYVFLIIGFILLIKGADFFVEGSASVAKKFNIPDLIIGLTIVSLGTSAPEIAVSTTASIGGANDVAISNIIGSNMFNLLIVIGVCAVYKPIKVKTELLKKELPFSLLATFVLLVMLADVYMNAGIPTVNNLVAIPVNIISRNEGLILLSFCVIFVYSLIRSTLELTSKGVVEEDGIEVKERKLSISVVFIIAGCIAIIVGGNIVVDSAVMIAKDFGLSETLIGLTIVAMGTSLPELVTSIASAKKGSSDMAIGNVVGSNIFNILLTLGICSTISPIAVHAVSIYDAIILTVLSCLVFVFALTRKKVSRTEGAILICIYIVYTVYIIMR